jgi:uncharacterized membrane protein
MSTQNKKKKKKIDKLIKPKNAEEQQVKLDENEIAIVEQLEKLSPVQRKHVIQTVVKEEYSGPIPPPEMLKQFNDIIPDGADRIMKMAESQSMHRQEIEKMAVMSNVDNSKRGQRYALIISICILIAGLGNISFGNNWAGFSLVVGNIATLSGLFIYGKNSERKERIEKNRQINE